MSYYFPMDEALLRGQIPLDEFKKMWETKTIKREHAVTRLEFPMNGYLNDAVLQLILSSKKISYPNISLVTLNGCTQITNAGIHCLTQILEGNKKLTKLVLDGCSQLADDDLAILLKLPWNEISMRGTSVRQISYPEGRKVNVSGCPVLTGTEPLVDLKYSHVMIIHQESMPCCSLIDIIQSKKETKLDNFKHMTDLGLKDWKVTLSEITLNNPLFDALVSSHPVQVIIPFHSDKGKVDDIKKHVVDTIKAIVTKASFTAEYPKNVIPSQDVESESKENETKEEDTSIQPKSEETSENIRNFRGCEFILLQIGNNPTQLEQLKEALKEDLFIETIDSINKNIEYHELHLADLDTVEQGVYATLCQTKVKLENFSINKEDKLHYLSLNTKSAEGLDTLLEKMKEVLDCHGYHQEVRYKIAEKYEKQLSVVMETVQREKIIDLSLGLVDKLDINGNEFNEIAKILHEQGRLLLFHLCSKTVIADVTYINSQYYKMRTANNAQSAEKYMLLAIHKQDKVMTTDSLTKLLDLMDDDKSCLLMQILQDYCGLIELPVFRQEKSDKQFVYVMRSKLKNSPPFSLKTYSFIYPVTSDILSALISTASKYGRSLLVTQEGTACQIGCVQTVVQTCKGFSDYSAIRIQSKCYLPEERNDVFDDETEIYVKEYLWNIFCLYTDLMETLLKQRSVVHQSEGDIPKGFVNTSIGCKHVWKHIDAKFKQSICTLCNKCCNQGRKCQYNGIMGDHLRECLCKTTTSGCVDCGICVECTSVLWDIRSYLRPHAICASHSTKCRPSTNTESVCSHIPLDPLAYNEVECQHIVTGSVGAVLKEVEDGTIISVFPGQAKVFSSSDSSADRKIKEVQKLKEDADPQYKFIAGDTMKIRITDPYGIMTKCNEDLDLLMIKESRPVYHSSACRDVRISHETGILCYYTKSSSKPVGAFIGPEPFSENLKKFSFKILTPGRSRYIGIGVAPYYYPNNSMPGWRAESYGYHADDGGIYIEKSTSVTKLEKCFANDIMSVYCDAEAKEVKFYKNDRLIYTVPPEKVNVSSRSSFYPIVSLHSPGESVKLLEKEVWTPRPNHVTYGGKCFDCYKYGNLWISPTKTVTLLQKEKTEYFGGWVILHNPTRGLIGYQLKSENCKPSTGSDVGTLLANESLPFYIQKDIKYGSDIEELEVEWIALDQLKENTKEEVEQLFNSAHENRKYSHRLKLVVEGKSFSGETLPNFSETEDKDGYRLDILKNSTLISSYLLKKGRYLVDFVKVEGNDPDFIWKRPKCPSFLYPAVFQKGMRVITSYKANDSDDIRLLEAIVTTVSEDGKLNYRFSDDVGDVDGAMCKLVSDEDWKEFHKKKTKKIEWCKDSNDLEEKTCVPAPSYLISKAGYAAYVSENGEWRKKTMYLFSSCSQRITRPSIQEQMITVQSRHLREWIMSRYAVHELPYSLVFLPSNLDSSKLMFPVTTNMYDKIDLHRLCCVPDMYFESEGIKQSSVKVQYDDDNIQSVSIHDGSTEKILPLKKPREVSLHFMDYPSFPMMEKIPVEYSYSNWYLAWNYVALLSRKLMLPSYDQILSDGKGQKLHKHQIEALMFQLVQSYASLCGIYATQHGGLSYQNGPEDLLSWVQRQCGEGGQTESHNSDDQSLNSIKNVWACKVHLYCHDMIHLQNNPIEPYSKFIDTLMIKDRQLPDNIFKTMNNLTVVSISHVKLKDTPVFLSGISSCKNLEILCLSEVTGFKELSKDVISCPSLCTFFVYNCPVRKLDIDWPVSSVLTSLTLKGLLLEDIPVGVGNLTELEELNLDYNPITSLPEELAKLKKLKHLSVKGIPWITFEGKYEQMPKLLYQTWHKENPFIVNNLNQKVVDKLFSECDVNSYGFLDKMGLARLNLNFLFKIPRLGNQQTGDREFGGIPPVIFKLTLLETLDLSYTAITRLLGLNREFLTLHTINLEHCPLLESIDGNVGLLPSLKSLHLNSCPSLKTPPQDIVARGFESVSSFLQKMAIGFTECNRTKLMVIGVGQAGKTTLLRALQNSAKKYTGSIPTLTDGIVIKDWMVPVNQDGKQFEIRYSCWDFAGQTVYYNTHQFFLSKNAVYMLLWNMRMGYEHAGLDFWLSSIACHCPESPVIVVGTQLDQIPMPDIREDELMKKYPQVKKFCYVSSTKGTNIPELEKTLIDVTLNHCPQMKMKIPLLWLKLEESIMRARSKFNLLEWEKIVEMSSEHGLSDERDIKLAVQFLDDLGIVQYFDSEVLRNKVVINPQWIVDVMAKIVSVNELMIKGNQGRFYHNFMSTVWKNYESSLHEWMLKLTEAFDLTFPLPEDEEKINIVPCLLPEKEPKDLPWPYLSEEEGIRESKIQYKFTYLPTGLFNRAQARLFSQGFMISTEFLNLMWKRGTILKKNDHYALVKQSSDYEMVVTVQGARPKNVLDLIHETISTLIKDSFHGVDYDFYIPCPDCLEKKRTREPYLFKADLISRAHNVNAPFLQCTKYFHTVSIGELMSNLPDNKETEFDVQMQQSISALQEISSNMAKDVAILYTSQDLPSKHQRNIMVDPRQINTDLKKAGLDCWFPVDMENTSELEMTMEIKNSKVLVVCMSEKFVQDPKCRRMFLYASEQLKKPFAIAVIDETLDFQHTDLGFKIGIPKMAMIKNVERYPKKILDLIEIVKDFMADAEMAVVTHPPVFISYCWSNSKEACNVTTTAKDGSLGYGDPRALKKHLEKNGMKCWLDIEQMGKFGLFQDITVGLQNAKVIVVCVSDEYLQSEACMMEARFGVYNLQLPLVVCVVGTGKVWKTSEVSLMISKQGDLATVVKMQKKEAGVYDQVVKHVRTYMERPETEKQRKLREKLARVQAKEEKIKTEDLEKQLIQQGDTRFSFQEEIELIQRKFLRHIVKMTRLDEFADSLPKLLVFDFVTKESSSDDVTQKMENEMGSQGSLTSNFEPMPFSSFSSFRKKPKLKRRVSKAGKLLLNQEEDKDGWKEEEFCIRALCEDEQGWHLGDVSLMNFGKDEILKALKDISPYLTRIYAILKQSAIPLNCLGTGKGEHFMNYVRKEGIGVKNFGESYKMILRMVAEHKDQEVFVNQLNRCYHQVGKISWLCSDHQNKAGITLLPAGTVNIHGSGRLQLFEEDILLSEYLQESKAYLAWKGEETLNTEKPSNKGKMTESSQDRERKGSGRIEEQKIVKNSKPLEVKHGPDSKDLTVLEEKCREKDETLIIQIQEVKPDVKPKLNAQDNESKPDIDKSKDIVDKPIEIVEKPKDIVEKPTDIVEKPKDIVEKPKDTVDKPKDIVDKPKDIADKPKDMGSAQRSEGYTNMNSSTPQKPKSNNSSPQKPKADEKSSKTCSVM